jgi:adenylosuccinate lyase
MQVWDTGNDFKTLVLKDRDIKKYLTEESIQEIFSLEYHYRYVEEIFSRVFK